MSPESLAREVVRIGEERDCMAAALRRLISIQAHGTSCGETEWYKRERKAAWAQARDAVGIGRDKPVPYGDYATLLAKRKG